MYKSVYFALVNVLQYNEKPIYEGKYYEDFRRD